LTILSVILSIYNCVSGQSDHTHWLNTSTNIWQDFVKKILELWKHPWCWDDFKVWGVNFFCISSRGEAKYSGKHNFKTGDNIPRLWGEGIAHYWKLGRGGGRKTLWILEWRASKNLTFHIMYAFKWVQKF